MKRISKNNAMQPLTGKIKTEEYIGFDIETQGENNEFVSCAFYSDQEEYYTKDREEAIQYIRHHHKKVFVATNLSFDFTGIFWGTPEWDQHKIIFRGSRIMFAEWKHNKKTVSYVDTMNFTPFGVAKLGEILGVQKLSPPSWLGERAPMNDDEERVFKEYNMRDAEVSYRFMVFLQKGINALGGNIRISSASTALDVFRRSYLTRTLIKEQHYINGVKEFIFEGYYGGRTEVFKRGLIEEYNYYDINSLYPSVMRKAYPLPNSVKKVKNPSKQNILLYEGVSECLVTAPNIKHPLLPLKRDDKLIFPIGSFRGVWNHCELRKALEIGYLIEPVKQIIYSKTFHPFREYVNDLYQKRLDFKREGSSMEIVVKLLLNSLYGKFAQRHLEDYRIRSRSSLSSDEIDKIYIGDSPYNVDMMDGYVITREYRESDGCFSFPILSSYTTSYARLLLYEYIVSCDPVYVDTDSVITKSEIETSSELGAMKLEKRVSYGVIVKPKLYSVDDEVRAKGFRRPCMDDFRAILAGDGVKKLQFSTIKMSLRQGKIPNSVFYLEKFASLEDTKRVWIGSFSPNRLSPSLPLVLSEVYL